MLAPRRPSGGPAPVAGPRRVRRRRDVPLFAVDAAGGLLAALALDPGQRHPLLLAALAAGVGGWHARAARRHRALTVPLALAETPALCGRTVLAWAVLGALLAALAPERALPWDALTLGCAAQALTSCAGRAVVYARRRAGLARGPLPVLVVGDARAVLPVAAALLRRPGCGARPVGLVASGPAPGTHPFVTAPGHPSVSPPGSPSAGSSSAGSPFAGSSSAGSPSARSSSAGSPSAGSSPAGSASVGSASVGCAPPGSGSSGSGSLGSVPAGSASVGSAPFGHPAAGPGGGAAGTGSGSGWSGVSGPGGSGSAGGSTASGSSGVTRANGAAGALGATGATGATGRFAVGGAAGGGTAGAGVGAGPPVLTTPEEVRRALVRHGVRHVLVAGTEAHRVHAPLLRMLSGLGRELWQIVPSPPGAGAADQRAPRLAGFPCAPLAPRSPRRVPVRKRALDMAVSGTLLLLSAPLLALCALVIRVSDGPGVLFRQERIGRGGRPFTLLKFRTLRPADSREAATRWNVADDSRVTAPCRFLRRTSLDELPQLWNVFRGDMSLVGPRPERPYFVGQFSRLYEGYADRHRMPTGITGLAQVEGLRGDTSIEDRARFDNAYIDTWSLWQDVCILLRTAAVLVRPTGS